MAISISDDVCISAYEKHKHLKLAADEIGMKWQTLYVRLRKNNIQVTGDKTKYGSMSDKIGARGERDFSKLVPDAVDQNESQFQAPIDFVVNGVTVDVKASQRRLGNKNCKNERWAFSIKKQESSCDFFVFMAYTKNHESLERVFLVPGDICRFLSSISITCSGSSKWHDYEVSPNELSVFFNDLCGEAN